MQSVKPTMDQAQILGLLSGVFEQPIEDLSEVQGGSVAQTLAFRVGAEPYILRFTTDSIAVSYRKEAFIYEHVASPTIPIPPVVKVGHFGDTVYAITRKLPGQGLQSLQRAEFEATLPSVMETLYAIHQVDVSGWPGYGWLDDHGVGMFASWKHFLARIVEEEEPEGFYGKWHTMFQTTFLERDLFETVYRHMLRLLESCPEEPSLVHGGYGYNNVLAQNGRVTAVLDWVDAMIGDFVYDIAWIDFWPCGIDLAKAFRQYYAEQGVSLAAYRERIACYKAYIGLDALRFFAKTRDYGAYCSTRQILQGLLADWRQTL